MSRAHYTYKIALARLRDLHQDEFDDLPRRNNYQKRLGVLRDRYYEEFLEILAEVRRNPSARSAAVNPGRVKPGLAPCYECGEPLLQHRIGQCRPDVYSLS